MLLPGGRDGAHEGESRLLVQAPGRGVAGFDLGDHGAVARRPARPNERRQESGAEAPSPGRWGRGRWSPRPCGRIPRRGAKGSRRRSRPRARRCPRRPARRPHPSRRRRARSRARSAVPARRRPRRGPAPAPSRSPGSRGWRRCGSSGWRGSPRALPGGCRSPQQSRVELYDSGRWALRWRDDRDRMEPGVPGVRARLHSAIRSSPLIALRVRLLVWW